MVWFILAGMIIIIAVIFFYALTSKVNSYVMMSSQNDLSSIGLSAKNFIGLHIKSLNLDHLNPKLIYVRKTTPYKGLILFIPDWKYNFHFYLPFLYWLCRKGYLIVTYTSEKEIYSQSPEEIPEILSCIQNDEVLKTYPLAVLGHGSGGYAALYGQHHFDPSIKIITLSSLPPEGDAIFKYVQNSFPFSIEFIKKSILKIAKRHFQCPLENQLPQIICPTWIIQSDSFYANIQNPLVRIENIEKKLHHPYLNMKSDLRLQHITEHLASPDISQFEYDKALETFDMSILYDLDLELAEKIDQFITHKKAV